MIEIKNLTKSYSKDKKAVDNLNLTIKDGEIFAFIGHNGAGKTTTIKCMTGILELDSGDVLINHKSIIDDPIGCKKEMAYIPDNPDMYDNLTGNEYINFICDMYEIPLDVRRKNIDKYAKIFEMSDKLDDYIYSYSHGMKQKVTLIAALAHDPKVLIMDEPFVGLDPTAVYDVKSIMQDMVKDGKTIFFSTHILDVAEKLCTSVGIIKNGVIMASGKMNEIKKDKSLEDVFLELDQEGEKHE